MTNRNLQLNNKRDNLLTEQITFDSTLRIVKKYNIEFIDKSNSNNWLKQNIVKRLRNKIGC
jgi:hypothetical protein